MKTYFRFSFKIIEIMSHRHRQDSEGHSDYRSSSGRSDRRSKSDGDWICPDPKLVIFITYLLNDHITARRFEVLYGLIINFLNLPSGRK